MTKPFIPSPQQADIFNWVETGSGNAVIQAVAGAGKTTTIIQAVARMQGSIAFAAYNKKIAEEIKERLTKIGSSAMAGTFHSFGFSAWRSMAPKVKVEGKKIFLLLDADRDMFPKGLDSFLSKAVSLAKQTGIGFLQPMTSVDAWHGIALKHDLEEEIPELLESGKPAPSLEECLSLAAVLLERSIEKDAEMIDFDDMIFCPLYHGAKIRTYDWVLVDEAQDTNPARRALAKKMLRPGGRLIAVGDRHQAIYGFTGADNDSLDIIIREFSAVELPLTVTYRCPKRVVDVARTYVSHIEAHPSAPEGLVRLLPVTKFESNLAQAKGGDAILCRNTKPLVEMVYKFIRKGIPAYVEGRDIGKGLLALVNRWKVRKVETLLDKLDEYQATQTQKMLSKGQEMQAQALEDKVETIHVIAATLNPEAEVSTLRQAIEKLFDDSENDGRRVCLSTIHKSKGREWNNVFWLGPDRYQPSRFARQEWQQEQEVNLMYVAATRAKETLTILSAAQEAAQEAVATM